MTLQVLNGGKSSAAGGSGGAGGGHGGGGRTTGVSGSPFEWHPLAEALFDAVYPKDADTFEQVRQRMSRIERRRVRHEEVGRTIRHVRDHEYGMVGQSRLCRKVAASFAGIGQHSYKARNMTARSATIIWNVSIME